MNIKACSTDRFRKTYRSLKKNEQELVDKGVDLWLQNPDNGSSNFEKLGFMGDNIFSIRLNSAWRVIMAKFDDVYFLLHTGGQHDKTNEWAKNKTIDRNSTTGAIQIYNVNVEEIDRQISNSKPEEEIKGAFENISNDDLMILGVPEEWCETVKKVQTEEQYMNLWDVLPEDALSNLEVVYDDSIDLKILLAQIKNDIEQKPTDVVEQIKIQPGFHVIGKDTRILDAMNEDISVFRFFLHPSQKTYTNKNAKGPLKLTGGAGTGKTVVALHRTKYLLENLKENDKPILFTTYTKYLIKNIRSLFSSQGIDEEKLMISNLHHFALKYAQEIELFDQNIKIVTQPHELKKSWKDFVKRNPEVKWDPDFLKLEYEEVIQKFHITTLEAYLKVKRTGRVDALVVSDRETVWQALASYEAYQKYTKNYTFNDIIFQLNKYLELWPEYRPFSHIICDEIQDFNNLEMRLLRNLVEEKENDLFLCGDPFQNIYQRTLRFSHSGINIRGKRSSRLKINYRTTEEIRQFAVKMLEGFEYDDFSGKKASFEGDTSVLNGNEPSYELFENNDEFYKYIIAYIKDSFGQLGLHEICITARTTDEVANIYNFLSASKIPVKNLKDIEDVSETENHIVVCTMHALKGLEFKNVIVAGFDKNSFPYKPRGYKNWNEQEREAFLKSEHSLYYVVFSRAISQLIVTGIGEKVPLK
jgi:hypothetical protein